MSRLYMRLTILILAAAVAVLPAASRAQLEVPEGALVVVNVQRVINESTLGKAARQKLEQEAKQRQAKLEGLNAEVRKLGEELKKQSALLSAAALEDKQGQLRAKERELERAAADEQEELTAKRTAQLKKVVAEIEAVLKQFGETNKYQFILDYDSRFVLYASRKLDMTDQIIKVLNEKKVGG